MIANPIDWNKLGRELRESAEDAHGLEHVPPVRVAYRFLLDNPESFGLEAWPEGFPAEPHDDLIRAYLQLPD